jgi:uncharacterized protein with HEPN domain
VDLDLVWTAAAEEVPRLAAEVRAAMRDMERGTTDGDE